MLELHDGALMQGPHHLASPNQKEKGEILSVGGHLTREEAAELAQYLAHWAETGTLDRYPPKMVLNAKLLRELPVGATVIVTHTGSLGRPLTKCQGEVTCYISRVPWCKFSTRVLTHAAVRAVAITKLSATGTRPARRGRSGARLTEASVKKIKKALRLGVTQAELAEAYQTTPQNIGHIAQGKTWADVKE